MPTTAASILFGKSLTNRLTASGEPLLFGVQLWASVCLALFVAFCLELDNPFWAGTTAAIVCQTQLGASLRKGWFRMIGTVVGATPPHVDSIAHAINVVNAQPNNQGVATVNPIFTWVRLAQRIPVRVHIDVVPPGVVLAAGMTATVEIDDRTGAAAGAGTTAKTM
jgi:hypothetical protein